MALAELNSTDAGNDSLSTRAKLVALVVLLLAAGLLFFGRLRAPLLEPEEAVYAEVPREMAAAGNWIVPLRLGRPYYEKPPLLFWVIMAGYSGFGVHEWVARLVPCAAGMGTVLLAFWWGKRLFGFRAGLIGAMILCLSPRFLHQARMITMDGPLCLFVLGALALGQQALQRGRLKGGYWLLSAAACGLGILTKGPVALVLVVLPVFAYHFLDRDAARPRIRHWLAYAATAAGLSLPWFAAVALRDPDFLREFFWKHHVVMRFVKPLHEEPVWFYVPALLLGLLPWTLLLPGLIGLCIRRSPKPPPGLLFLLVCGLWCFVFFSAADCKRIGYVLPAMPALALALGYTLDRRLTDGARLPFWMTQGVLVTGIAGAVIAARGELLKPVPCVALIALASAGMAWTVYRRRQGPAASWATCGLAMFVLLFLTVQFLLPSYFRQFSMRQQVGAIRDSSYDPRMPVACYPHHWDSISFYLQREDMQLYGPDRRTDLLEDLQRSPTTLLFVKTKALEDLLLHLPPALEFVPRGQSRTVTAGLVRRRDKWGGPIWGRATPFPR